MCQSAREDNLHFELAIRTRDPKQNFGCPRLFLTSPPPPEATHIVGALCALPESERGREPSRQRGGEQSGPTSWTRFERGDR